MKDLIIIGAGNFGREVLSYAIEIEKSGTVDWKIKGFINDILDALDKYNIEEYKIISTIKNYEIQDNDVFVCAISDPKPKLKLCQELVLKGAKFINFIHPTASIMDRAVVGQGLIMGPYSVIGPDCIVGDFVTINRFSSFGHDAIVGDGCTFSSFCDVTGHTVLSDCVFMGSHSSVTPHVKVGSGAKISAGSIVFKNIKSEETVYGNPAKKLF